MERTKQILEFFNIKNGEEITNLYLKSDVILPTCVFEKFKKVSVNELGINTLYCVYVPSYTWLCGLKDAIIELQTLQDKDMILILENNIRGVVSSVMSDRSVKRDDNKKIMCIDANILYGHSMSQLLPHDGTKFHRNVKLADILIAPDDSDIGYFIEIVLKDSNNMKEKTKSFPFAPENKKIDSVNSTP